MKNNMNYLNNFKIEKLAEWYNIFNNWDWPEDFIQSKPIDWESLDNYDHKIFSRTKYNILSPYINVIPNIIGEKECLRYHHIHNLKMKNYQFEIWWFVNEVINHLGEKYINKNFYFNIYGFMRWEKDSK